MSERREEKGEKREGDERWEFVIAYGSAPGDVEICLLMALARP